MIEKILNRLDKVRKSGSGYVACCPAHEDKSPSLAISQSPGGGILLHCFAGCEVQDVLTAIGLEFNDLFPDKLEPNKKASRPFSDRQLLEVIYRESGIIELAAWDILQNVKISDDDYARITLARERIKKARNYAN